MWKERTTSVRIGATTSATSASITATGTASARVSRAGGVSRRRSARWVRAAVTPETTTAASTTANCSTENTAAVRRSR